MVLYCQRRSFSPRSLYFYSIISFFERAGNLREEQGTNRIQRCASKAAFEQNIIHQDTIYSVYFGKSPQTTVLQN